MYQMAVEQDRSVHTTVQRPDFLRPLGLPIPLPPLRINRIQLLRWPIDPVD